MTFGKNMTRPRKCSFVAGALSLLLSLGCATRQDQPFPMFAAKKGEVVVVGKVEDVYPMEMHIWEAGAAGHSTSLFWHVVLAIESPKELRGLRPNFSFSAIGREDYGHLKGRLVTVRLRTEQAAAMFIDILPTQLSEGRAPDAEDAATTPISAEPLTKP